MAGLMFCGGMYYLAEGTESGLKEANNIIGLELANVALWGYVLLYRKVYDEEQLRRSWGFIQATEEENNKPLAGV